MLHFLRILLVTVLVFPISGQAHDSHEMPMPQRMWKTKNNSDFATGSFLFQKSGRVYIELQNSQVKSIAIDSLSTTDAEFVAEKQAFIEKINQEHSHTHAAGNIASGSFNTTLVFWSIAFLFVLFVLIYVRRNGKLKHQKALSAGLVLFMVLSLSGFTHQAMRLMQVNTDPNEINQAFTPFVPNVHTFWDGTYFWVESRGIPTTHNMMVGISNHGWQRQVPIPQCYLNTNAWPIPLNPVISSNPIPVSPTHFTRGAIGIAVNGVPIFNPYTNTGVDAFLDGQLDAFGGHCGRGDDYHYHTAPLHLYNHTEATLPIAYALDGFAVYGAVEPEGGQMMPLDTNNGHFGNNGVYHYHGVNQAPYMVARFAGQVTEDATHQLIPQPHAQPVRPGQQPLNGALITACTPNATGNGYTLVYTLGGATDSIQYSWTPNGQYHFSYFSPAGQLDSTFNGFVQCTVPFTVGTKATFSDDITIYPNPTADVLHVNLPANLNSELVNHFTVYTLDGAVQFDSNNFEDKLDVRKWSKGVYLVRIQTETQTWIKKILIP